MVLGRARLSITCSLSLSLIWANHPLNHALLVRIGSRWAPSFPPLNPSSTQKLNGSLFESKSGPAHEQWRSFIPSSTHSQIHHFINWLYAKSNFTHFPFLWLGQILLQSKLGIPSDWLHIYIITILQKLCRSIKRWAHVWAEWKCQTRGYHFEQFRFQRWAAHMDFLGLYNLPFIVCKKKKTKNNIVLDKFAITDGLFLLCPM